MRRIGGLGALVLLLLATGLLLRGLGEDGAPSDAPSPTAAPTGAGSPTSAPTSAPTPDPTPTEGLSEQVARVAGEVARLRGLAFEEVPDPTVLAPADLAGRVREDLASYTEEDAGLDSRLLALLGAVPDDYPLREKLTEAYAGQVVGYYDPDGGELVVGAEARGRLSPLAETTLAHELDHALTDQALGLPALDDDGAGADEILARQSLVEGDATLLMQDYVVESMGVMQQLALLSESLTAAPTLPEMGELPHYIRKSLLFPYEEGLVFASALREAGGWPAVDDAYDDLPTSSLEILFPEAYQDGFAPTEPADPADLGAPWRLARSDTLGAADLLLLAEAPGGDPGRSLEDPRGLAGAWRGGVLELWVDEDRSALGLSLAVTGGEACRMVRDWYGAAFPEAEEQAEGPDSLLRGPSQTAVVACAQGTVTVAIAPTTALARTIAGTDG